MMPISAQPVPLVQTPGLLDDVPARLRALPRYAPGMFEFDPGKRVTVTSHLQGIVRLDLPTGSPPVFVISQQHKNANKAGFLYVSFPGASGSRGPITPANPHGPGLGQLTHFISGNVSEHPGGLQGSGSCVVAAQDPRAGQRFAFVSLIDASNPAQPSFIDHLTLDGSRGETPRTALTCCGLIQMTNRQHLLAAYRYSAGTPGACELKLFCSTSSVIKAGGTWTLQAELSRANGLPAGFRDRLRMSAKVDS